MNPDPAVTICIFTWNRKGYLKLALEAALAQTHTDLEVLVMDNASEDGTDTLVRSYADPRIRYHRNPYNRGAAVSYCLALKKARGRLILLSHDDDVMGPDLVRRQVEAFRRIPGLQAVTTNVSVIDENGNFIAERRAPETEDRVWPIGAYIHTWNAEHLWLPFPTLMIRRPLVRRLFRPRTWYSVGCLADIFTMARLNMEGPIAFLADPLLAYRQHSQQAQFRYDQIDTPTRLHRKLVRMASRPGLRKYQPLALLLLLKYCFQKAILGTREPVGGFHRLSASLRSQLATHARKTREALRKMKKIGNNGEALALAREFAQSPWGPQIAICSLLVGAGEDGIALWDATQDTPFHRWMATLRAGGRLCGGLPAKGIRRVAIMGSLLNAALVAMDAHGAGVEVVCFLDSNRLRCKTDLARIPIQPPSWLADNRDAVDAVIISSENGLGERVIQMLEAILPPGSGLPIQSWKDLTA